MGLYPIKKRVNLICQNCGESFEAKRVDTKYCPPCRKIVSLRISNAGRNKRRAEVNARAREYFKHATPAQRQHRIEMQRIRRWRDRYNLTPQDFNRMLQEQNHSCLICQKQLDDPHVDHCHDTNRVRGLLCDPCNRGLGFFKHNPELLKRAAGYLLAPVE